MFGFAGRLLSQENIEIIKPSNFLGLTPPTPIAITGFTGDVDAALKFDLTVMGFTNVPPDAARYVLSGGNGSGEVHGQLALGGAGKSSSLFNKSYRGGDMRAQAHRLTDDVVLKLTGVNGIAETRIAFKGGKGRSSEIYVSDYDGHNPISVTHDNTDVAAPCWVPGHFAVYYTSYKLGNPDIFYQDLGSGQRHNFSHFNGLNTSAAVSPDGHKVAMILSKSGSPDLYVCDSDGKNLKQLTKTPEDESSPCWSPDGQWICYCSKINEHRALYKVSVNGGPAQRIATSGVSNPSEPDWSPDGKWIVFTSQMRDFEICVVPAQGGSATPLVSGEDPCWAPNSRTVVFVRRNGGNRVLSLLDVPTKQTKDASRVSGSDSQPSWAR